LLRQLSLRRITGGDVELAVGPKPQRQPA
jgi:hypothetical protein